MKTMKMMEKKLRKANHKQSRLYLFCNFISLMLITAYAALMCSPTVLHVLPEGGDSRKQMMAIFALTCVGCVFFTVYASSLFFRNKSKQLGTLMALGASKKRLAPGLFREVLTLSGSSGVVGIVAGIPFVWLLWNTFRLIVVDSAEMTLVFDYRCLVIPAIFFIIVVGFASIMGMRYLNRTDILDVIREEHKNEPVREPGRRGGIVGIMLVAVGAVAGYSSPAVYMAIFQAYPGPWLNLLYAPVFIGLYMIMLHTVVYGWTSHKKKPYKNIVARSMMKFQGKQTVNNLMVMTVLIAGACWGIFYIAMTATNRMMTLNDRPYDYEYHFRADQDVPKQAEIQQMAAGYGLSTQDWKRAKYITLAMDGEQEVEREDNSFYMEYRRLLAEANLLGESGFNELSGQQVDITKGTYRPVLSEGGADYMINTEATLLTNMVTRQELNISVGDTLCDEMLNGYYVLDDADYAAISTGLTDEWCGEISLFNVAGTDRYDFANDFFHTFVKSFGPECEKPSYYDRVAKSYENEAGREYWADKREYVKISYDRPDSTDFRENWSYIPQFRILDYHDFLRSYAVYLMMFLFIAIVCILSAMIIGYTRCMTIVLNNRYVFEDLKRLGAPPVYLIQEVKRQAGQVFKVPALVGLTIMYILYVLIMYGNDGRLVSGEVGGLLACLAVVLVFGGIIYGVYRKTVLRMRKLLKV